MSITPVKSRFIALAITATLLSALFVTPAHSVAAGCGVTTSQNPQASSEFYGVAHVPGTDDMYAVGRTGATGGYWGSSSMIQHWNGSAWTTVADVPSPGAGYSVLSDVVALAADDVWAIGVKNSDVNINFDTERSFILHWNGTDWSEETIITDLPAGAHGLFSLAAGSANDIWAVGYQGSDNSSTFVLHFNGTSWSVHSAPEAGDYAHLSGVAVVGSSVLTVGEGGGSGGQGPVAHRWNGSSWTPLSIPLGSNQAYVYLDGLAAISGTDAWAIGAYYDNTSFQPHGVVMRLTGDSWSNVSVAAIPAGLFTDVAVSDGGDTWFTGFDPTGVNQPFLAHWSGTSIVEMPHATPSGTVPVTPKAIAISPTDIWTVGTQAPGEQWLTLAVRTCGNGASDTVADGGSLATSNFDAVTADEPIATTVDLPAGVSGDVTIRTTYSTPLVIDITAPTATAAGPLVFTFQVDNSQYVGSARDSLVFRNGEELLPCTSNDGSATPDPCVESDIPASTYHQIVVRTSAASTWTVQQQPVDSTITTVTTVDGTARATFDEDVQGVSTGNLYIRESGKSTNVSSLVSCKNSTNVAVACSTGPVRTATVKPVFGLAPGQTYTAHVNAIGTTPIEDTGGFAAATKSQQFTVAKTTQQESSKAVRYDWKKVSASSAYGSSYVTSALGGSKATYTFMGTSVKWYTVTGPTGGKASITLDGVAKPAADTYSSTTKYKQVKGSYTGLAANTPHTLTITVTGTKNASSKGANVAIDAFQVGASIVSTPAVVYGWQAVSWSGANGGKYARANAAGNSFSFTFRGSSVRWYAVKGPGQGKAQIFLDGVSKGTIDLYRSSQASYYKAFTGLSTTRTHTVKVVVLGTKTAASKGTYVTVDRFTIT